MIRTVGRNSPPFCRTILFRGVLPFEQPAGSLPAPDRSGGHWVVKRWPDKVSAGRKRIGELAVGCCTLRGERSLTGMLVCHAPILQIEKCTSASSSTRTRTWCAFWT